MAKNDYEMYKQLSSNNKCSDCGEKTSKINKEEWVIDYRNSSNYKKGDTAKEYLCFDCGNKINKIKVEEYQEEVKKRQKQKELVIKEKANQLFTEINQLWKDLESKVENENLTVKDVLRINSLKSQITKLLKEKGVENYETYWMAGADFEILKETLTKLDNFVKENTSPKTIDEVKDLSKIRGSKIKLPKKTCFHKVIVSSPNDPNYYYCSYCWESESEEFLKVLKSKGLEQGKNQPVKDNNPSYPNKTDKNSNINRDMNTTERERERAKSNTPLYVSLGLGAIALIGGLVYWFTRKKKD